MTAGGTTIAGAYGTLVLHSDGSYAYDRAANTPLGLMHGIDFDIDAHEPVYDEPWRGRLDRGEITAAQAAEAARQLLNVVLEPRIVLIPKKDAR